MPNEQGQKPKYSVIIVTFNAIEHTVRCLEALYKHTKDFELIVVDNNSTDGTCGYLNEFGSKHPNFIGVYNSFNSNFGPANNQGVRRASGERIVFLNSDTVVTPGWLDRMDEVLQEDPKCAIVGPMSCSSNGRQMTPRLEKSFSELDRKALEWTAANWKKREEAGILYGWCMLVRREFLDAEPEAFDERFINSYEDNDLCLRARLKGWRLVIDRSTYIYHHGQGSFLKALGHEFRDKYMANGYRNQDLFFQKWKPADEQKLVAVYRIANCEKYIRESLERTSEFADEIVVLLARSQDRTEEIARSFPKVSVVEVWNEPEHPFDEQAERDWLLQKAIERGATWVISVDGDEVYEKKFVEMVPRLMRNPNPQIFGYWCNWRTIWDQDKDGREMFRSDGIFGGFQNYRFFKVLPGMKIEKNSNIYNHHCGSSPHIPQENLQWLNVRVKHMGYDTFEQRVRKYNFYRKADPNPVAADVGNADYHHLIDQKVDLKPWIEDNKLSVMTVVRNEAEHIRRMLDNIHSIADEIVVIDNGSTDETVIEVERFAKTTVKPVRVVDGSHFEKDENGMLMNYSEAKNFGKAQCRGRWILNMDADELFEPQLLASVWSFTESDIDAFLFNVVNYLEPAVSNRPEDNKFSVSETIRLYRNIDELFYSGLVHESLEDSATTRVMNGKARVLMSPVHLHHHGYLKAKEKVREKIDRYARINERQSEVAGGQDPRVHFNLALHYFNEGKLLEMIQAYEKCLEIQPAFWRAKQNLAFFHLHQAKKMLGDVKHQMPVLYRENSRVGELCRILEQHEFMPMKVG